MTPMETGMAAGKEAGKGVVARPYTVRECYRGDGRLLLSRLIATCEERDRLVAEVSRLTARLAHEVRMRHERVEALGRLDR